MGDANDCIDCEMIEAGADIDELECPNSRKDCKHHCNHTWSHDCCCWCDIQIGEDGVVTHG